MRMHSRFLQLSIFLFALTFLSATVKAVAPSPESAAKWMADGTYAAKTRALRLLKAEGACQPEKYPVFTGKSPSGMALAAGEVDTAHVLVILVDFSDNVWTGGSAAGTPAMFDSLLFSEQSKDTIFNNYGSMTEYYLEDSYGKFYMTGDIVGWYRMPGTYASYVGSDGGSTMSQTLANQAIDAAVADGVNFSKYDGNHDGRCDGVIVVHAGPGGEIVGGDVAIWSHKFSLPTTRYINGIAVSGYDMVPEEYGTQGLSRIGVFCHEFGHMLGLPDLYDVDGTDPPDGPQTSDGLGRWDLMATGNYNNNSYKPAHMSAWCKNKIGFLSLNVLTGNLTNADLPEVENSPVAYMLSNGIAPTGEYWVVENRQKIGFDVGLPGQGLCIYHVDENAPTNNSDQNRYYVALEQADGLNQLATALNTGDEGDPFPGSTNNRNFNTFTSPSSLTNDGWESEVGVWNISDSDSLMHADLDITYSRPYIMLEGQDSMVLIDQGNGDGTLDPGETFELYVTAGNYMRTAYNARVHLSINNPGVTITSNDAALATQFNGGGYNNAADPITFTLANQLQPKIDTLMISIITDSLPGVPGSANFTKAFPHEVMVAPRVLIVDADRGKDYEKIYQHALYGIGVPYSTISQVNKSPVSTETLSDFDIVLWLTGDSTSGAITADDIASMKSYMDGGGNLMLSSISGTFDMFALDPTFMADYFHASVDDKVQYFRFNGITGTDIGDGTRYQFDSNFGPEVDRTIPVLSPVNGSEAVLQVKISSLTFPVGVAYSGSYKSALFSIPIEYLTSTDGQFNPPDTLIARVVGYFGGTPTAVWDGQPFDHLPTGFELNQNYPNPFNPTTTIAYTIHPRRNSDGSPQRTELAIYNVLGQRVKTLVDKVQIPGTYQVEWSGDNEAGHQVASGVYFYRLVLGDESATRKMLLVK